MKKTETRPRCPARPRTSLPGGLALGVLVAALSPGEARADDLGEGAGLSVRVRDRPMTLPSGTLRVDGDVGAMRLEVASGADETWAGASVGVALGLTDDLMVFVDAVPLRLSPDFDYGDPDLGAVYRFTRGSVEVGAGFALGFYDTGPSGRKFNFALGVPVHARIGRHVRLETGLGLDLFAVDDYHIDVLVPVTLVVQATDRAFLGLRTGLGWHDLLLVDTPYTPAGAFVGYTIAGPDGRPVVDLTAFVELPFLFAWGSRYAETIFTDLWTVGLGARFFVDLQGGPRRAESGAGDSG